MYKSIPVYSHYIPNFCKTYIVVFYQGFIFIYVIMVKRGVVTYVIIVKYITLEEVHSTLVQIVREDLDTK